MVVRRLIVALLAAALVDGFVLPEVERQNARREELAEDGKYASAAGKELEKVVAAVELIFVFLFVFVFALVGSPKSNDFRSSLTISNA